MESEAEESGREDKGKEREDLVQDFFWVWKNEDIEDIYVILQEGEGDGK